MIILLIINELYFLSCTKKQYSNFLQSKSKFKVVNYISVDCSACFNVIKVWYTLFEKNKLPDNVNVCFITYGEQKDVFSYYLDKLDDNPFGFYEEINQEFISLNPIKDLKFYKTVLINEKNEVLLIGNPFDNKAVMDKYIKMGVIQ